MKPLSSRGLLSTNAILKVLIQANLHLDQTEIWCFLHIACPISCPVKRGEITSLFL